MGLRATVVLFMSALCKVAFIEARDLPYSTHFASGYTCKEPQNGSWRFQSNLPPEGFPDMDLPVHLKTSKYLVASIADATLTRATGNVYEGKGTMSVLVSPKKRKTVSIDIVAIFDTRACVLSGTIFETNGHTAQTFRWHSYGMTMSGPYVVTVDGKRTAPVVGVSTATLVGKKP